MLIEDNGSSLPKIKILALAYACSPYRGSEAGVGWNRSLYLSKHFDMWVVCKEEIYKSEIQQYINENGDQPNLHFIFLRLSGIEKLLMKSRAFYYIGYRLWHKRAYTVAKDLHKQHNFSLSHMMTFCGYREPGYLWKLPIPFIWGPVGGVQDYPSKFLLQAGLGGAFFEGVRTIINTLQKKFSIRIKCAMKKAHVVLAANKMTANQLKIYYSIKPLVQLDICLQKVFNKKQFNNDDVLKVLWSGQLKHHKALQLLLEAISQLTTNVKYELHILGMGPLEKKWQKRASDLKIINNVKWLGWLSHEEALKQFEWANLFVFTSLRDTTGTVILEALSHGVPVICLDHQGAADIITNECGIKVPVTKPSITIAGIRDAIVELYNDREKLSRLSNGAIERARDFLWEKQIAEISDLYKATISNTGSVLVKK